MVQNPDFGKIKIDSNQKRIPRFWRTFARPSRFPFARLKSMAPCYSEDLYIIPLLPCSLLSTCKFKPMDWFQGKLTGKPHIFKGKFLWFLVDFPLTNPSIFPSTCEFKQGLVNVTMVHITQLLGIWIPTDIWFGDVIHKSSNYRDINPNPRYLGDVIHKSPIVGTPIPSPDIWFGDVTQIPNYRDINPKPRYLGDVIHKSSNSRDTNPNPKALKTLT